MIVEECKSYSGKCPCIYCSNKECIVWITEECDTEKMCEMARRYCKSVHEEEALGIGEHKPVPLPDEIVNSMMQHFTRGE